MNGIHAILEVAKHVTHTRCWSYKWDWTESNQSRKLQQCSCWGWDTFTVNSPNISQLNSGSPNAQQASQGIWGAISNTLQEIIWLHSELEAHQKPHAFPDVIVTLPPWAAYRGAPELEPGPIFHSGAMFSEALVKGSWIWLRLNNIFSDFRRPFLNSRF